MLIHAFKFIATESLMSKPESTGREQCERGLECKENEIETTQETCKKEREQLKVEQERWKKEREQLKGEQETCKKVKNDVRDSLAQNLDLWMLLCVP